MKTNLTDTMGRHERGIGTGEGGHKLDKKVFFSGQGSRPTSSSLAAPTLHHEPINANRSALSRRQHARGKGRQCNRRFSLRQRPWMNQLGPKGNGKEIEVCKWILQLPLNVIHSPHAQHNYLINCDLDCGEYSNLTQQMKLVVIRLSAGQTEVSKFRHKSDRTGPITEILQRSNVLIMHSRQLLRPMKSLETACSAVNFQVLSRRVEISIQLFRAQRAERSKEH